MPSWTKEQQIAINEYRDKTLLVSAAAGSGKTAVLIERIYKLITEDGVSLDNLLIVTFTKAAVAEMRDRLRERLSKDIALLKGDNSDEAKKKFTRLSSELSKLSTALICTFNSFALWIIKNYYQEIGADPSLKICDEFKAQLLKNEAMDELFAKKYEEKDEDFIWLLDRYSSSKNDADVRKLIDRLYTFLDTLPDPENFTKNHLPDKNLLFNLAVSLGIQKAEKSREFCFVLDRLYKENGVFSLSSKLMDAVSMLDSIIAALKGSAPETGLEMLEEIKFPQLRASKAESEAKKAAEQIIGKMWDEDIKNPITKNKALWSCRIEELSDEEEYISRPLSILINLCREFKEVFSKKKLSAGLMDFSDSEHLAIKILENGNVRSECRKKFQYILVDEYQDSNYIQETIIKGVSSPQNVFMVGDVKQSIYRFRRAEPELFMEKYAKFKAGEPNADALDLSANFRCKAGIIDFVNRLFRDLLTKESCGIDYDKDAELVEGNVYTGEYIYEPELYLVERTSLDGSGEYISYDEEQEISDETQESDLEEIKNDELEAFRAAEIIQKYYGKPYFVSDNFKKDEAGNVIDDGIRNLSYSDMAILLRSAKTKAEFYYEALTKAGIPAILDRNVGLYEAPEIQLLFNLLKVIDNFKRDLPLIGTLHCPCFSFSGEELARIRLFAKENKYNKKSFADAFIYYCNNGDEEKLKEKCTEFKKKIEGWRIASYALSLPDFINKLLSESGLNLFAASLLDGQQRSANLRIFIQQASDYESENAGGLSGFISFIDSISADKKIDAGLAKNTQSQNAVRIMTIHKSKGQQFPFVLIAGCGEQLKTHETEGKASFHKKLGSSICIVDKDTGVSANPVSLELIREQGKWEERAEELRLLYVATTRAKDILVLLASARNTEKLLSSIENCKLRSYRGKNFLEMMLPYFKEAKIHASSREEIENRMNASGEGLAIGKMEEYKKTLKRGFEIDESKLEISKEEIEQRLNFDYKKTPKTGKRKYSVSELARDDSEELLSYANGRNLKRASFDEKNHKVSGAEKGNAYHALMERLPFGEDITKDLIESVLSDLVHRNIISDEAAKSVEIARVLAFFESEIGRELKTADKINKETPFVLKTTRKGKEILVQGTIDCWYEKDGRIYLIDYKSSHADRGSAEKEEKEKERLLAEYKTQLALYKEALEKICKKEVSRSILYLFSLDSWVEI